MDQIFQGSLPGMTQERSWRPGQDTPARQSLPDLVVPGAGAPVCCQRHREERR